jgi:Zn-dependent protease
MDSNFLIDGLMFYLELIILLTLHEFGHAWMASRCGDNTARLQGRVSVNPVVHLDPIGTVVIPLFMIFLAPPGVARFLVGWAKPVPVNPRNFDHPQRDDILVTMAGPGMNLILAVLLVAVARVGELIQLPDLTHLCVEMAALSLMLCFFNLIPIPPLDGSHVLRVVTGMTYETYNQFARYGLFAVIIALQIPLVKVVLSVATLGTLTLLEWVFNLHA